MNGEKIPTRLKVLDQWVAWIARPKKDNPKKTDKLPIDVKTGKNAKSNNPQTWSSFENAEKFFQKHKGKKINGGILKGVGFVFSEDDPFTGIDVDNCIDDQCETDSRTQSIIDAFDSYTELSQSGAGLHIIIEGAKPGIECKKNGFECYDKGRFFAITGDVIPGKTEIREKQAELDLFYQKYFSDNGNKAPENKNLPTKQNSVDASKVLERALKSRQGAKIQQLMEGGSCGFASNSEADQALCNHLVFFCGNIPDDHTFQLVDEIFRNSNRYRDKWDKTHVRGDTYGKATICKAIADNSERWGRIEPGIKKAPDETEPKKEIPKLIGFEAFFIAREVRGIGKRT
jgi:putative DNA primase/helicase